MFTVRNMGGIALLLFGSTFLWLTPAFVTRGLETGGAMWSVTNLLSLAAVGGFTVATWGLFRHAPWWETVALISAVVGIVVLGPYWLAARHAGEAAPGFNVLIHALGDAGVFILLLVPSLETWVSSHVMAGH